MIFTRIACVLGIFLTVAGCAQTEPTPQKFGGTWTMNLGDRIFLSDSLRRELGVPSLASQKDQQRLFLEQFQSGSGKA